VRTNTALSLSRIAAVRNTTALSLSRLAKRHARYALCPLTRPVSARQASAEETEAPSTSLNDHLWPGEKLVLTLEDMAFLSKGSEFTRVLHPP
jgi:hypothetical protein